MGRRGYHRFFATGGKTVVSSSPQNRKANKNLTARNDQPFNQKAFQEWVASVADSWKTHEKKDLEFRHDVGKQLNEHLGPPSRRQPWGAQAVKRAAKKWGKTEAELNQLRWFAFHFQSVKVLHRKHPAVTTWTQVRDLLPKLQPRKRRKKVSARTATTGLYRKIATPLETLTKLVRKTKVLLPKEERAKLAELFQELVDQAPQWLRSPAVGPTARKGKAA